jgi:hypothetical protein
VWRHLYRAQSGKDNHPVPAYSVETIAAMRDWIDNCCIWPDLDTADVLTDQQVIAGITRHYEGGISQFLEHTS